MREYKTWPSIIPLKISRQAVEPHNICVIPRSKDMSIIHRALHATPSKRLEMELRTARPSWRRKRKELEEKLANAGHRQ